MLSRKLCNERIDLGRSSRSQVLQHADPAIFAFHCASAVSQRLFVAFQIHRQGGQNDGRIGLVSMTNAEVDAIQVILLGISLPKVPFSEWMHLVASTSHQRSIIFTPDLFIKEQG